MRPGQVIDDAVQVNESPLAFLIDPDALHLVIRQSNPQQVHRTGSTDQDVSSQASCVCAWRARALPGLYRVFGAPVSRRDRHRAKLVSNSLKCRYERRIHFDHVAARAAKFVGSKIRKIDPVHSVSTFALIHSMSFRIASSSLDRRSNSVGDKMDARIPSL